MRGGNFLGMSRKNKIIPEHLSIKYDWDEKRINGSEICLINVTKTKEEYKIKKHNVECRLKIKMKIKKR